MPFDMQRCAHKSKTSCMQISMVIMSSSQWFMPKIMNYHTMVHFMNAALTHALLVADFYLNWCLVGFIAATPRLKLIYSLENVHCCLKH